jgi:DNA-binding MarR family transcriptional regulator
VPAGADARPDDGRRLDDDLGWALGVVFRDYVRAVDHVLADVPGGPRGLQVLTAAAAPATGNQGALAGRLGVDRTVMTYLVDDLVTAGLVTREPDPHDRRSRILVATTAGRALVADRRKAMADVEGHVLAPLGADADRFRGLLQRLACTARGEPLTCTGLEQLAGSTSRSA